MSVGGTGGRPRFRWRLWARAIHRDAGFLLFGLTVAYAVSGLALNHRHHWNPSYRIEAYRKAVAEVPSGRLSESQARDFLAGFGLDQGYKKHYEPDPQSVRFFFEDGSATLHRDTAQLEVELLRRRPLLHTLNTLHYNPGRWWTWFADLAAAGYLLLAVTGLFLVKSKYGLTRRGGLLLLLGLLIPGCLVYFYL